MKLRLFLLALSVGLMTNVEAQDAQGFIAQRSTQGALVADPVAYCSNHLTNLCTGSTFQIVKDNTDNWGIRHITLQQYVDGIRVEGKLALIHMRNGHILSMNGSVMTNNMSYTSNAKGVSKNVLSTTDAVNKAGLPESMAKQAELVLVVIDGVCHKAYRLGGSRYTRIIDASTGDILRTYDNIRNLTSDDEQPEVVTGTANTLFCGIQQMPCLKWSNGKYTLGDTNRHFRVYNSAYQYITKGIDPATLTKYLLNRLPEDEIPQLYRDLATYSIEYTNDSPNWTDTVYYGVVDSIVYTNVYDFDEKIGKKAYAIFNLPDGGVVSTDTITFVPGENALTFKTPARYYDGIINGTFYLEGEEPTPYYQYITYYPRSNGFIPGYPFFYNRMVGYRPILDVNWGMSNVIDYYKERFNMNSFDNKGTVVNCFCNPHKGIIECNNASAMLLEEGDPGTISIGMGDDSHNPIVTLSVIGHEYTHLVACNLKNGSVDAPALDESFADFMGLSIYLKASGRETWIMGENFYKDGSGIRSFSRPEDFNHPSCYHDSNFSKNTESRDEHVHAGVQNHMFYLLCKGGSGVNSLGQNYDVTPMDRVEVEKLAFNVLYNYTYPEIDYPHLPEAYYQAATAMYGAESSQLASVKQAWAAVGLGEDVLTGIEQISTTGVSKSSNDNKRYNILGQPVGKNYRGLYIENGKVCHE